MDIQENENSIFSIQVNGYTSKGSNSAISILFPLSMEVNWSLLLYEKIASLRSIFFHLRVDSSWNGFLIQGSKLYVTKCLLNLPLHFTNTLTKTLMLKELLIPMSGDCITSSCTLQENKQPILKCFKHKRLHCFSKATQNS